MPAELEKPERFGRLEGALALKGVSTPEVLSNLPDKDKPEVIFTTDPEIYCKPAIEDEDTAHNNPKPASGENLFGLSRGRRLNFSETRCIPHSMLYNALHAF